MTDRTSTAAPVCAVCGMGGYWVGFVAALDEYRCLNHLPVRP